MLETNPYEDLMKLPNNLTGEILNGQLYARPHPSGVHAAICSNLGIEVGGGGPGGWWIIDKPEVHFQSDRVLVPDIGGWERGNLPNIPADQKFTTPPDWVCEVLPPATRSLDREVKALIYAAHGVKYLWLVDALERELEVYRLVNGMWVLESRLGREQHVSSVPFERTSFQLEELWL